MTEPSSLSRRTLHFDHLDQMIQEAASLASGEVQTSGRFSFGQILEHLALAMEVATGRRPGPKIAAPIRWGARLLRSRFIHRPLQPGFKLPRNAQSIFWPEEAIDVQAALEHLRHAVNEFQATDPLPPHPIFGKLTREEHEQLQCRHCELHLSFVHPVT